MPPPPKEGHLYELSTVLSGPGHNGEQIHGNAYVSSVYHVLVPESVSSADDSRDALALGLCASYTGGYTPCWVRDTSSRWRVRWSSSHPIFFHDVVPSLTQMPRIAVAADLQPVAIL